MAHSVNPLFRRAIALFRVGGLTQSNLEQKCDGCGTARRRTKPSLATMAKAPRRGLSAWPVRGRGGADAGPGPRRGQPGPAPALDRSMNPAAVLSLLAFALIGCASGAGRKATTPALPPPPPAP